MKKEQPIGRRFKVTFYKPKEYSPISRTVEVITTGENAKANAIDIVHRQFGSIKRNPLMPWISAPSDKIIIESVVEYDADGNIVPEVEPESENVFDGAEATNIDELKAMVDDIESKIMSSKADDITTEDQSTPKKKRAPRKKKVEQTEQDAPTAKMIEKVN